MNSANTYKTECKVRTSGPPPPLHTATIIRIYLFYVGAEVIDVEPIGSWSPRRSVYPRWHANGRIRITSMFRGSACSGETVEGIKDQNESRHGRERCEKEKAKGEKQRKQNEVGRAGSCIRISRTVNCDYYLASAKFNSPIPRTLSSLLRTSSRLSTLDSRLLSSHHVDQQTVPGKLPGRISSPVDFPDILRHELRAVWGPIVVFFHIHILFIVLLVFFPINSSNHPKCTEHSHKRSAATAAVAIPVTIPTTYSYSYIDDDCNHHNDDNSTLPPPPTPAFPRPSTIKSFNDSSCSNSSRDFIITLYIITHHHPLDPNPNHHPQPRPPPPSGKRQFEQLGRFSRRPRS